MISTFDRQKLTPPASGSVVSIGMFDGVHLGHMAILAANVKTARGLDAVPTIVTFRRHPKKLLLGHPPRTLTTLEHRLELFARAGIEHTVVLNFDADLRDMSAGQFAREIARDGLGVRRFVLGFDSKFGHDRGGTPEFLRAEGYQVDVADRVRVAGRAVSSTAIREAVELGDLKAAAAMLGRPVSVFGKVVRGANLGHKIGFPTANLDLHHELHPPPGVYACRARHIREDQPDRRLDGVANIGFRPTVTEEPLRVPLVEVHLFDFDGDLYGERLELEFVAHLRGEKRFDGIDALTRQIQQDTERARALLAAPGSPAAG